MSRYSTRQDVGWGGVVRSPEERTPGRGTPTRGTTDGSCPRRYLLEPYGRGTLQESGLQEGVEEVPICPEGTGDLNFNVGRSGRGERNRGGEQEDDYEDKQ